MTKYTPEDLERARAIIGGCTMDYVTRADCMDVVVDDGERCECCSLSEEVATAIGAERDRLLCEYDDHVKMLRERKIAALAEQRERHCKAVCEGCRKGWTLTAKLNHHVPASEQNKHCPHSSRRCAAAAIRRGDSDAR